MLSIRSFTPADIPAGLALCRAMQWNQLAIDWEMFLRLNPDSCCAAFDGEALVGTVATVSYDARFSWIGMMLVAPHMRRQGVGTMLMSNALEILQAQETVRLDATPVGREVYLKMGFVDEYPLHRMHATIAENEWLDSPARPMQREDLAKLRDLDFNVFGANRVQLLEWLRADAPEYAWVVDGPSGIAGYCLGRHGYSFEHLGPVIAPDLTTTQHLVSACLRHQIGKPFLVDATPHNTSWIPWLNSLGFTEQRLLMRMYRGANRYPGEPENQFSILGPEFG